MPRRPPRTWRGTCSKCHRQVGRGLLRKVRSRSGRLVFLCPICYVPRPPRNRTDRTKAPSPAMTSYKAGTDAPEPPADPKGTAPPLRRRVFATCEFIGCGKAGTVAPDGHVYCFAHAPPHMFFPTPHGQLRGG